MRYVLPLFLCLLSSLSYSQETTIFQESQRTFLRGMDLYNAGNYPQAKEHFDRIDRYELKTIDFNDKQTTLKSRVYSLLCSLHLNLDGSTYAIQEFLQDYYPQVISKELLYELALYEYNNRNYTQAIVNFDLLEVFEFSEEQQSECDFKKGYSLFVKKDFGGAERVLARTTEKRNIYYYPSNYYYGMSKYFQEDYKEAISSFERVGNSNKYKSQIPYYISQIHFAQGDYDQLLSYGERKIKDPSVKQIPQIRLLLGQAYFKKKQYDRALRHLEFYESNTPKLTKEEFYQLAFTQYQLKDYQKAQDNFLELSMLDSKMGQVSNYYLADCYLKNGNKTSAAAALKKVSRMNYDIKMRDEAEFNFGKLSAELSNDREAINTFKSIPSSSQYYRESQSIMSDMILNSQDFSNSLQILQDLNQMSEQMSQTYQVVAFNQAIQNYNDNDHQSALTHFNLSLQHPYRQDLELQSKYWKAVILQEDGNTDESIRSFDDYFVLAKNAKNIPQESSVYLASYNQGFNYFQQKKYGPAALYYRECLNGIEANREKIKNPIIVDKIYQDALIRTGDCLFKNKSYNDALRYYHKSINQNLQGADYAMYQKANIEGLKSDYFDQLITLESLVEKYPNSKYADKAYFLLGETYSILDKSDKAFMAFQNIPLKYRNSTKLLNKAYLRMGLLSYNQGDADRAIEYYKNVFNNSPLSSEANEAMIALEEIYIKDIGKPKEYFEFAETQAGFDVDNFSKDSLSYTIGEIQFENGEYEKSIISYSNYLNSYKQGYFKLEAHNRRGEANSILKNYSAALRDFQFLVQEGFNPFYNTSLKKCAIISYNHQQNFKSALSYYALLSDNSRSPEDKFEAHLGAMRSAFRINDNENIIKYSNLVSTDELATNDDKATSYYYLGKTLYNQKRYEEAVIALQQISLYAKNNQTAEASFLISQVYYNQGKIKDAEKQCQLTNNSAANYPFWIGKSILLLSDIYSDRNDLINTRAALEAILENFQENQELKSNAEIKMKALQEKEKMNSRIRMENEDGLMELDTTGNK